MREYDQIADWYAASRGQGEATGVPEALAMAAALAPGGCILDVGCGNGVPITQALRAAGHRVVGLDSSGAMLSRFAVNLPGVAAVQGDIRGCPFADGSFDAAIAWGVMFHLTPADQAVAFAALARVLRPGAAFLFTAGEHADDGRPAVVGTMNNVEFRYYAVPSYRELVAEHGFEMVSTSKDAGDNTYFLARRSGCQPL